ncbi:NADPH-dependent FMN reductase [Thetidibacter halocola]|uniref:NAD(P)H-dependent oxidoreductase n=1 Tax=Thetidibacter halocola TaxID=2827239 RepID=A0A8J7WG61_9RHOB|nr:NAD(P)H-dependent oxidoreductase [Thetidibacter halocola]MBS0124468.1 NAD(P)H-dependent oxidoreductase [Thetidibacter halocola]
MPKILFVPGSLRAASSARATTRTLIARIGDVATCETADIGALPHYNADVTDDPAVAGFVAQVKGADGLIFVTPEYNYSVPGVLKNAIDWASRPAFASVFAGKPCAVVSVSGGALGGVRAQAHLKYILNGMLAEVHPCKEIVVPMANDKVTDGVLADEAVLGFAMEQLSGFLARLS